MWCAHEYTLKNLQFALSVESGNLDLRRRLAEVQAMRQRSEATIPSNIGLEKRTNPFLRWDVPTVQQAMQTGDAVQTLARLRQLKDHF